MTLAELNQRVTDAITLAESLPKDSPGCWAAFREVSALEERIALLTDADDVEGEIARLGAVSAALSANEPLRAVQLGEAYQQERLAQDIKARLAALVHEANVMLHGLAKDLTVRPVRYRVEAA